MNVLPCRSWSLFFLATLVNHWDRVIIHRTNTRCFIQRIQFMSRNLYYNISEMKNCKYSPVSLSLVLSRFLIFRMLWIPDTRCQVNNCHFDNEHRRNFDWLWTVKSDKQTFQTGWRPRNIVTWSYHVANFRILLTHNHWRYSIHNINQ